MNGAAGSLLGRPRGGGDGGGVKMEKDSGGEVEKEVKVERYDRRRREIGG